MIKKIFEEDLNRLISKGSFTTDELIELGFTEDQAMILIKKLAVGGFIKVMPLGIEEN